MESCKFNAAAFVINQADNVATALCNLSAFSSIALTGDAAAPSIIVLEAIQSGHKIALSDIMEGEMIIKYGVTIGKAITKIQKGAWVHLHNIKSTVDERSSHLDPITGAPQDIAYE